MLADYLIEEFVLGAFDMDDFGPTKTGALLHEHPSTGASDMKQLDGGRDLSAEDPMLRARMPGVITDCSPVARARASV